MAFAIALERKPESDPAFLFRCEHIITGALRRAAAERVRVIEIDGWFGARWCGFAGTRDGQDVLDLERLRMPPFAFKRVRGERTFARRDRELIERRGGRLHPRARRSGIATLTTDGRDRLFAWYSGGSARQDRAALMVYEMPYEHEHRAWYCGFVRKDGAWHVSETLGIDHPEIEALEHRYHGALELTPPDHNWMPGPPLRAVFDRAYAAWFAEQPALARHLAERLLVELPGQPAALWMLAHAQLGFRKVAASAQALRSIGKLAHVQGRVFVAKAWAQYHGEIGDWRSEEACLREVVQLRPEDMDEWLALAFLLVRQRRLDEAIAILRHATTLPGEPEVAHAHLGFYLRSLGRFDEAIVECEATLAIHPRYRLPARVLRDIRLLGIERSALRAVPDRADPVPDRPDIEGEWMPSPSVWPRYVSARDAADQGDRALARHRVEEILSDDPLQPAARCLWAELCIEMDVDDDVPKWLAALAPLASLPEERERLALLWCDYHEARGDEPAREPYLREFTRTHPDTTPAWIILGGNLARQGKHEEALAIHRHAATLEGDVAEALLNAGLVLRGLGRLEEAEQELVRSLAIDPSVELTQLALRDVRAVLAERKADRSQ
ncbi:MAG: tetratricopeptide repeat protein [Deltaproteobacteria bacterium]|nr:tetratricopeptide repeat protein [Nannocystaceae bacterium]